MKEVESARMHGKRGATRLFRSVQPETLREMLAVITNVHHSPLSVCMFYVKHPRPYLFCNGCDMCRLSPRVS